MKQGLINDEARIIQFLLTHGRSTASDVSRYTGIQRTKTYECLSLLLAKGIVFSTFDRPQKYYTLSVNELIDTLFDSYEGDMGEITKKDYNQVVEAILKNTLVPIPDEREGYQIVMGATSVNAKIKRMVSESKKSVLMILSDRMLASMFHSKILDLIVKTNSKGIEVKLRTPSKHASDYVGQICADSRTNNNPELTLSISKIDPLPIELVIVDESYAIIMFASYNGPGALTSEQAGFWTNQRDLVSFYKYLFERLP